MAITTLTEPQLLGSREIQFLNRQETRHTHLQRLVMDFGFRVLELLQSRHDGGSQDEINKRFVLVTDDYRQSKLSAITPEFECLSGLNDHVGNHMTNLLHDYLFGFVDEDISLAQA
ncbi:hypothetical protein HBA55_32055 [Pseudomaricurvus alkylphenolicus]|uniref:hypothetical protein n=1 Tax=Pseudomaricurvus alkylphenolicus TaxID=1306991 RepID=UPI001421655E|nr:hypothetical protein [Pseudomaricurvus alkylphenolicus]NIB44278.1 hypothetical protein [Pseudomaricurvus alkylphenolicus]